MKRVIHYLPDEARRILILRNPTAGAGNRGRAFDQLVQRLRADTWAVESLTETAELSSRVQQIPRREIRAVIAAGGDGTVSTTVKLTPPGTPIGIFPLGTENLLAKYLGVPRNPQWLAETVAHGATVELDAGQANGTTFLLMAGCGFDADVVTRLHRTRRGNIRHWSYIKPILDSIRSYEYPVMRVYCEPEGEMADTLEPEVLMARWVFVVNLPRYAGGLNFVPTAVGTDGLLDVCTFERGSMLHGLRYLFAVMTGYHHQWKDVTHRRVKSVRVESDSPVTYQLDGDPGGVLPLRLCALAGRLRLLVRPAWATRHGFPAAPADAASE